MWNDDSTVAAAEELTVNFICNLGAATLRNLCSCQASAYQQGGSLPSLLLCINSSFLKNGG